MLILTILNFNGMDTLEESIDSVLIQTKKPDKFMVIDNSSTDDSKQIAIKKGIEVIDATNRFKFITGLNKAQELTSRGDDLFFMQNDVILHPSCLETMLNDLDGENEFIAQPIIYRQDGKIDNCGMDIFWPGYGFRRHKKWWSGSLFEECGLVTTICYLLRSNNFLKYDERFYPAYYEDLSFKLDYDLKHYLAPYASCIHKGNHTFSQTLNKKQISNICRTNRIKFINKHFFGVDKYIRLLVIYLLDFFKKHIF